MNTIDLQLQPLSLAWRWPAQVRLTWSADAGVSTDAPAVTDRLQRAAELSAAQGWITVGQAQIPATDPLRDLVQFIALLSRYFVLPESLAVQLPKIELGDDVE